MKELQSKIFPKTIDNKFTGNLLALYTFLVIAIVSTGRSLIHLFSSDGGAGKIAGLDLSNGSENIIFAFGLWGLSQLLFAILQLLVSFKYRSLIPLFYILLLFEILGRMLVGYIKTPMLLNGPPPGGIANYVLLPVVIFMLFLSLKYKRKVK